MRMPGVVTGTIARWNDLCGQEKGTVVFYRRVVASDSSSGTMGYFHMVSDRGLFCLRVLNGMSTGFRAYS